MIYGLLLPGSSKPPLSSSKPPFSAFPLSPSFDGLRRFLLLCSTAECPGHSAESGLRRRTLHEPLPGRGTNGIPRPQEGAQHSMRPHEHTMSPLLPHWHTNTPWAEDEAQYSPARGLSVQHSSPHFPFSLTAAPGSLTSRPCAAAAAAADDDDDDDADNAAAAAADNAASVPGSSEAGLLWPVRKDRQGPAPCHWCLIRLLHQRPVVIPS